MADGLPVTAADRDPGPEEAALVAVQAAIATPPVVAVARAMSHFGEHALGWVVLSGLGALVQPKRRRDWLLVGAGAVAAHAAAIMIKLVVRRARPNHPAIAVNVATPSALSFPSAHATSTTAAAMLLCRAPGHRCRWCWCPRWPCRGWCSGCTTRPMCLPGRPSAPPSRKAAARLAGRSEGDA